MAIHRGMIFATIVVGAAAFVAGTALRGEREAIAPTQVAEMAVASTAAPTAAPAVAPTAAPKAASTKESRRSNLLHASEALAAYRSTFVERCWTPPSASGPDHVDLRFNLAFDPGGTLVGVGISDSRKAFRADVSACLRGLNVELKIPPPGVPTQLQVPLTLP